MRTFELSMMLSALLIIVGLVKYAMLLLLIVSPPRNENDLAKRLSTLPIKPLQGRSAVAYHRLESGDSPTIYQERSTDA